MDLEVVATRVAAGYAGVDGVAGVMVAGSVGRGRQDEFSDVEVDVYWSAPPTVEQRRAGALACDGQDVTIWDYDADDEEYSDDFRVHGVSVGISGFTVATVEGILGRLDEFRVVDQLRLSALTGGRAASGLELLDDWRRRAVYGDDLQRAAAAHHLGRIPAGRWRQVSALVAREDWLAARQLCDQSLEAVVGLWCAVNRRFVEHPRFKWSPVIASTLANLPAHGASRLSLAAAAPLPEAVDLTRALVLDTLELIETYVPGSPAVEVREAVTGRR